jgi:hypothetical protein
LGNGIYTIPQFGVIDEHFSLPSSGAYRKQGVVMKSVLQRIVAISLLIAGANFAIAQQAPRPSAAPSPATAASSMPMPPGAIFHHWLRRVDTRNWLRAAIDSYLAKMRFEVVRIEG